MIKYSICILLCLTAFSLTSISQVKKPVKTAVKTTKPPPVTPLTKFKPPVVKTYLGRNSGEATVMVEEANQLVNFPLKIVDDKNVTYTVSSYQFMYKKRSVVENENTGKKEISFSTVSDLFKVTPLPKIWKENIGGGIQKDEELFFFDIIVNDKQNRKFYAPNLKIKVQ